MSKKLAPAYFAAASALTILSAQAADLPAVKGPPPAPPAPAFTWTGFHIGYNKGYGGAVYEGNVALAAPLLGGSATRTFDRAAGWFVGGQIGYDYQFANGLVLGLETDMQWSDIQSSHQATTTGSNPLLSTYADTRQSLEWFGTTRARLGYSFGRLLPYVTGGVAYGETTVTGTQFLAAGLTTVASGRSVGVGWAAGAGLDFALSGSLSARAEYLYLQLPGVSGQAVGVTPPPFPALAGSFTTGPTDAHLLRAGMNYRFGGLSDLVPSFSGGGLLARFFEPPALDWSGFYAGVNAGYSGGTVDGLTFFGQPGLAFSTYVSNRFGGAIAGGQLGYNYRFGEHIVVGLETDAQWSGVKAWHQATTVGLPNGFVYTDTPNGMSWFGTTRARLGWAMGSSMLYATGGVAYGDVTTNGVQLAGALFAGAGDQTKVGWTAGSGTEYALTDNLSLKSEYLYVSFSGLSGPAVGLAALPFAGSYKTGTFGANITRIGLNWRFGGGPLAPIVAKY